MDLWVDGWVNGWWCLDLITVDMGICIIVYVIDITIISIATTIAIFFVTNHVTFNHKTTPSIQGEVGTLRKILRMVSEWRYVW